MFTTEEIDLAILAAENWPNDTGFGVGYFYDGFP
jgi:hypothetical protein